MLQFATSVGLRWTDRLVALIEIMIRCGFELFLSRPSPHVRKASSITCRATSNCHATLVDRALQSQLLMPPNFSAEVAAAVSVRSEYDATLVTENIQFISSLFPRSSLRSIEKLLLKNPRVSSRQQAGAGVSDITHSKLMIPT